MGKRGPPAKFVVRLSSAERTELEEMVRKSIGAAYRLFGYDSSVVGGTLLKKWVDNRR